MSSHHENINYSAQDIEKYLAGNLTPQQMHAMEKAALDDPFLADAMEGYETIKNEDWNPHLAALRQQLSAKGQGAKVIPLHKSKNNWWKAVAAVLVLGAGAVVTFLLNQNNKPTGKTDTQIATVKTVTPDTVLQNQTTASVTVSVNPTASDSKEDMAKLVPPKTKLSAEGNAVAATKLSETKNAQSAATPVMDAEGKNVTVSAPVSGAAEEKQMLMDEKVSAAKKQASKAADEVENYRSKTEAALSAKKEAALNNFFTAQVVSSDNSPLPFTNISVKKDNFGTYADAKGMLRLVSTDSVLNIEVKSVGYMPKTFTLRNNQPQTKIVLQEDVIAEKDKMVVSGNKTASPQGSRRATLLTDSLVNVEPADGWDKYNTYVANNLYIPDEMLKRDIHGEVELSFDVKKNGTISNIKVNKSLGAEYDEAAKRLLLEGPQWKVKNGKKTSASVKVKF